MSGIDPVPCPQESEFAGMIEMTVRLPKRRGGHQGSHGSHLESRRVNEAPMCSSDATEGPDRRPNPR